MLHLRQIIFFTTEHLSQKWLGSQTVREVRNTARYTCNVTLV